MFVLLSLCLVSHNDSRSSTAGQVSPRELTADERSAITAVIDVAMTSGDVKGAELITRTAESYKSVHSFDSVLGNLFHKTGVLWYMNSEYERAVSWFNRALPVRQHQTDVSVEPLLNTLNGLGQCYLQLFQYDKVEITVERQLALMEKFGFRHDESRADLYLSDAQLAFIIEDYSRCQEKLRVAEELYEQKDTVLFNLGLVLNMLGATYDLMGQHTEAISCYHRAIDVFSLHNDKYHIALAYHNLGIVYGSLKEFAVAESLLEKSYSLHVLYGDSVELARNFVEMARVKDALLQKSEAVELARKSLLYRQQKLPAWHPDVIESEVTLANLLTGLSDDRQTDDAVNRSAAEHHFDRAIANALASPRAELAIMPLVNKASWLATFADEDLSKAVQAHTIFHQADSLIQVSRLQYRHQESKIDFTRRIRFAYEQAIGNALHLFNTTQQQEFFEDAVRFSSRSKATAVRDKLHKQSVQQYAGLPDSVLSRERQLHLKLGAATQALLMVGDQRSELYEDKLTELEIVKKKMEEFDEQLEELYPRYFEWLIEPGQKAVLKELQESLTPGSLMVEYFVGDEKVFVFGVSPKKFHHWVMDISAKQLSAVVDFVELMDQSLESNSSEICSVSYASYRLLLHDAITYFSHEEEITALRIVPDGIISKVPFDALLTRESGSLHADAPFLLKKYSHNILYSHRQILEPAVSRDWWGGLSAVVFGIDYSDPKWKVYDTSLTSLPFMQEEVDGVLELNPGQAFLNDAATVHSFKKNVTEADVVHVAVHGLLKEDRPQNSGLIFSYDSLNPELNNILSLPEIYGLQSKAKFIYLSSCYSGKGNLQASEGVMSLSRAFTYAGVKSQVITLWEVSDRASAVITREFYRLLLKGFDKDVALREAKLHYIRQSPSSLGQHPFFWAGSVVVGQVEPLHAGMRDYAVPACVVASILGVTGFFFFRRRHLQNS